MIYKSSTKIIILPLPTKLSLPLRQTQIYQRTLLHLLSKHPWVLFHLQTLKRGSTVLIQGKRNIINPETLFSKYILSKWSSNFHYSEINVVQLCFATNDHLKSVLASTISVIMDNFCKVLLYFMLFHLQEGFWFGSNSNLVLFLRTIAFRGAAVIGSTVFIWWWHFTGCYPC